MFGRATASTAAIAKTAANAQQNRATMRNKTFPVLEGLSRIGLGLS
jgi:hypothetical protein